MSPGDLSISYGCNSVMFLDYQQELISCHLNSSSTRLILKIANNLASEGKLAYLIT